MVTSSMDLSPLDRMVYLLDSIRDDWIAQSESVSANKRQSVPQVVITGAASHDAIITPAGPNPNNNAKAASNSIRRFNISGKFNTGKATKPDGSRDINANVYPKMTREKSSEKISPLRYLIHPSGQSLRNKPATSKDETKPALATTGRQASCTLPGEKLRSSFRRLVTPKDPPVQHNGGGVGGGGGQPRVLSKTLSLQKRDSLTKDFQTAPPNKRPVGQGPAAKTSSLKSSLPGSGVAHSSHVKTEPRERKALVRCASSAATLSTTSRLAPGSAGSAGSAGSGSVSQASRPRAASSAVLSRRVSSPTSTSASTAAISKVSGGCQETRPRVGTGSGGTQVFRAAFERASTHLGLPSKLQSKLPSTIQAIQATRPSLALATTTKSSKSASSLASVGEGAKLFRSSSLRGPLKVGSLTLSPLLQAATKSCLPGHIRTVATGSMSASMSGMRGNLKNGATRCQKTPLSLVHSASESAKKKSRVPTLSSGASTSTARQGPIYNAKGK